ncbi:MAG: F0F1 ATP synthase subunit epsilon [Acidobacteria bacterium]|nr:F0F1 ATP synthase subunit epsilon [Acidobacteriota bacterium]MXZ72292.1 F0F1 ATP synthase subunit epsilon [Acidobacteriota bacterium]MYD71219.1 F0F1 ATP synthase subunit epsilon [Acidobacteriota bacterium]MYJ03913.1 F0F1 ATP synthase subunit epsilon [Acidobacteriota bacterium]
MPLPQHLTIEIVTPDRAIVHETVDEAQIPGAEGYLGVLPGHTPLLVTLDVGEVWFRRGEDLSYLHVAFGFAEILPDRIRILARTAERADEIDIERAEAAAERARKRLAEATEVDFQRARIALLKSLARLQVAERMRRRRTPVR